MELVLRNGAETGREEEEDKAEKNDVADSKPEEQRTFALRFDSF